MLRFLGAVLLMGGASAIGFSAAAHLRARVACLRAFTGAVEYLEREMAFRLTPIPLLFDMLARSASAPAAGFFARCSRELERIGEKPLNLLWREALEKSSLPIEDDEEQVLAELGDVLGRYDGDAQREAFALAHARLDRMLERAEEERDRLEKVYGALGLSAGAFLLLLLL